MTTAAKVKWSMKGQWLKNCNCDAGCPCDFNREPTHHYCEGMVGMHIVEGHYGDVRLDGLTWLATYHWPGPLHEGNGTAQPFIDARADQRQREAILQVLSGQAGDPYFDVVKAIVSNFLEPQFLPIEWEFDRKSRRARVAITGQMETIAEPIKNPVTGEEHHAQVSLPEGFEYSLAEIGNARVNRSTGAIKYDHPNSHSSLAEMERTSQGLR